MASRVAHSWPDCTSGCPAFPCTWSFRDDRARVALGVSMRRGAAFPLPDSCSCSAEERTSQPQCGKACPGTPASFGCLADQGLFRLDRLGQLFFCLLDTSRLRELLPSRSRVLASSCAYAGSSGNSATSAVKMAIAWWNSFSASSRLPMRARMSPERRWARPVSWRAFGSESFSS